MDITIKNILKHSASINKPLSYAEAYWLGCRAVEVCDPNADQRERTETIVALTAIHNKATYAQPGAAAQIAGVCAAVFEKDIQARHGFIRPNVPFVMDNCGMGGDMVTTANVSTLAALIAAAHGVNMCKHGSPANTDVGRHGSSDFVQSLGIEPMMSKAQVEHLLPRAHFAYTEALDDRTKRIHLQTHQYARIPHMNDIIGPITNPVDPVLMQRRVIGVNHMIDPEVIVDAYTLLNEQGITHVYDLYAVRGFADTPSGEGMDELSICAGGTKVAGLRNGQKFVEYWQAEDFGLAPVPVSDISPPANVSKGEFSAQILSGSVQGAPLQMVLANAALLLMLAEGLNKRDAFQLAKEIHASGRAVDTVSAVKNELGKIPAAA